MRRRLLWVWMLVGALSGLLLASCRPGLGAATRSAGQASTGEVPIRVEVAPLHTPVFASANGAETQSLSAQTEPPAASSLTPAATPTLPAAGASGADVAAAWFDLAYRLVRDEKLAPPQAARLFGYAGVTLWEAVAPGIPGSISLARQLNELEPLPQIDPQAAYHWPAVANSALATLFGTLQGGASGSTLRAVADLEKQYADQFRAETTPDVWQRSVAQGERIGLAIFDWAQADGYAYLNNCSYTPPSAPGAWEPAPPGLGAPLQPCWGQMRPFVLRERSDECQPRQRPTYSEDVDSQFYLEAREVYLAVNKLTPEQQEIARFWSDDPGKSGTPPGHSLAVMTQNVQETDLALDKAAEAYARLGIALADSFISCWQTKFTTNIPRPITYIQKVIDPKWTPFLTTPSFPEYTSGHSVQASAAAAVLTAVFGEDYAFVDYANDGMGYAPRPFASFVAMADEAAISRLYGGIHYRSAIEAGQVQGRCIGERVNALRFRQEQPAGLPSQNVD